jgi:hypothetical protein
MYLSHVKAGIEIAASDLCLTLDERDLAWLDVHQARQVPDVYSLGVRKATEDRST